MESKSSDSNDEPSQPRRPTTENSHTDAHGTTSTRTRRTPARRRTRRPRALTDESDTLPPCETNESAPGSGHAQSNGAPSAVRSSSSTVPTRSTSSSFARLSADQPLPTISQRIGLSISNGTLKLNSQRRSFNEESASQSATGSGRSPKPRFNGVSAYVRSRGGDGSGGGGVHGTNTSQRTVDSVAPREGSSESTQVARDEQSSNAQSLLSTWLSMARSKIVKKETTKQQLRMSWYCSEEDTGEDCCICLDNIGTGCKVTRVRDNMPCRRVNLVRSHCPINIVCLNSMLHSYRAVTNSTTTVSSNGCRRKRTARNAERMPKLKKALCPHPNRRRRDVVRPSLPVLTHKQVGI